MQLFLIKVEMQVEFSHSWVFTITYSESATTRVGCWQNVGCEFDPVCVLEKFWNIRTLLSWEKQAYDNSHTQIKSVSDRWPHQNDPVP